MNETSNINKFYASYRFKSDMDAFQETVDNLKTLLDDKKVVFLIGFYRDLCVEHRMDEEEYASALPNAHLRYNAFCEILQDEIVVLLMQYLRNEDFSDEQSLQEYLIESELDDEEIERILSEKMQKSTLVKEQLSGYVSSLTYEFKHNTIHHKLLDIKKEYSLFPSKENENTVKYASIEITTARDLPPSGVPLNVMLKGDGYERIESVSFVCTGEDIEYLIDYLTTIKGDIS